MNANVSDIESPLTDDVNGIHTLYPPNGSASTLTVSFPPRNESLGFRTGLEAKYRDGLHRAPTTTFVDVEGAVVWTQEYLRYRVGRCSHPDATARVFMQIDGFGIQPVCGAATGTSIEFPPRNETLNFRQQLEVKYRDGLRRGPRSSYVDPEGDRN